MSEWEKLHNLSTEKNHVISFKKSEGMNEWVKKSRNLSTPKTVQPITKTEPKNITQPLLTKTHATSQHKNSCNLTKQKNHATSQKVMQPLHKIIGALSSSRSPVVDRSVRLLIGPSVYVCEKMTFRLSSEQGVTSSLINRWAIHLRECPDLPG